MRLGPLLFVSLTLVPTAQAQGAGQPPVEVSDSQQRFGLLIEGDVGKALASRTITAEDLWGWLDEQRDRVDEDLLAARVVTECARALALMEEPNTPLWQELLEEQARAQAAQGRIAREVLLGTGPLRADLREREAQQRLQSALDLLPRDNALVPYFLHQLADIARSQGRWGDAQDLVTHGLAVVEQQELPNTLRSSLLCLRGDIYLSMGLVHLAAKSIEQGLDEARELLAKGTHPESNLLELFAAHRLLAELRLATDSYGRAIDEIEALFSAYPQQNAPEPGSDKVARERAKLTMFLGLASLEVDLERPQRRSRGVELLEATLGNPLTDLRDRMICRSSLAYDALVHGEYSSAAEYLRSAQGEQPADEGPGARGYLIALEGRLAMARGGTPERLADIRDRLRGTFDELLEQMDGQAPRAGGLAPLRYARVRFLVGTLMELELRLDSDQGPARALELLFEVRARSALVRRLGFDVPGFQSAREQLLPAGTGALVYFVGKDRSFLFVVERKAIAVLPLAGERPLWKAVDTLNAELLRTSRGGRKKKLDRAAQRVGELLLPSMVGDRIASWGTVYVIGDDLLHSVPLECLPFGESTLDLEKAVVHLDSFALGTTLLARADAESEKTRSPARSLCLVAFSPPAGSGYPTLPFEQESLERLMSPFDGRATLLRGPSASWAELTRIQSDREVLSILGHGIWDDSLERASGIVLASGKNAWEGIFSDRIEGFASPPIVILGACQTGRGPAREGGGSTAHLGGAFLFAGARTVILSASDLAYEPTVLIMAELHDQLAAGVGAAEALRRAKVQAVKQGWTQPAHYSRLQVIGLAQ